MSNERCPLCGDYIVDESHNGRPLIDAQVCSFCNYAKVIPARVDQILRTERGHYGKY